MKRIIKRLLRWFIYLVVCMAVLGVASVALLMSDWFINGVLFPTLFKGSGYSLSAQDWKSVPWKSVQADNVVIEQTLPGTAQTGMVVKADTVSLEYDFLSLFTDRPIIRSLELTRPALGITSLSVTGMIETSEEVIIKAEEELAAGKAVLAEMPLCIDSLKITDGRFSYYSLLKQQAHVHDVNLTAQNIGPGRDASLTATGIVKYRDTDTFKIESVPVRIDSKFSYLTSVIPASLNLAMSVSNITGKAGDLDLAPATALVTMSYHKDRVLPVIHIDSCNSRVDWAQQTLGRFSVTGMIHLGSTDLSGRTRLELKPSPLWQVLSGLEDILDISQSDLSLDLVTRHDNKRKITDSQGYVSMHNMTVPSAPEAGSVYFSARFTNSYDLQSQTLSLPFLSINARQGSTGRLQVRTEKPLTLCFDSERPLTDPGGPPARLSALVENMNVSQLTPFLKDSGVVIRNGTLSAHMLCDVTGIGEHVTIAGNCTTDNLDISIDDARWKECDLSALWAGDIADRQLIRVKQLSLISVLDGVPCGEAAATGFYNLQSGSNKLAVAMTRIRSKLLRPLIDPNNVNRGLDGLTYALQALTKGPGTMGEPQDSSFKLTVFNSPRAGYDEWKSCVWRAQTETTPEKLDIRTCDVLITPSPWQENKLSLNGTVMLVPTNVPGEVLLYAKYFDATGVINTFMPPAEDIADTVDSDEPAAGVIAREPLPLNLDNRIIILRANLEHARIREVIFEPMQAVYILSNNVLNVTTRKVVMNDGDVQMQLEADLGVTGYVYQADITLTNIPVTPVMNTVLPNNKNSVNGKLFSVVNLQGRGITRPNIEKHFKAETRTVLRDGRLLNAPVLKQLGDALRYQSLKHLPFEHGIFDADMKNGILTITDSGVNSDTIKAGLRGTMNLDRELDMKVMLGLSGSEMIGFLSKWIPQQRLPLSQQLTNFYQFPVIPIAGSLDDPSLPPADELFKDVYKAMGSSALNVMQALLEQNNVDKIRDVFKDDNIKKSVEDGLDLFMDIFTKPKDMKNEPGRKREQKKRPDTIL
jgi:hypothetical protein